MLDNEEMMKFPRGYRFETLHHFANVVRLPKNARDLVLIGLMNRKDQHILVTIVCSDSNREMLGNNVPTIEGSLETSFYVPDPDEL